MARLPFTLPRIFTAVSTALLLTAALLWAFGLAYPGSSGGHPPALFRAVSVLVTALFIGAGLSAFLRLFDDLAIRNYEPVFLWWLVGYLAGFASLILYSYAGAGAALPMVPVPVFLLETTALYRALWPEPRVPQAAALAAGNLALPLSALVPVGIPAAWTASSADPFPNILLLLAGAAPVAAVLGTVARLDAAHARRVSGLLVIGVLVYGAAPMHELFGIFPTGGYGPYDQSLILLGLAWLVALAGFTAVAARRQDRIPVHPPAGHLKRLIDGVGPEPEITVTPDNSPRNPQSEGQRLLLQRRYSEAEAHYDGQIAAEPGSAAGWLGKGIALVNSGRVRRGHEHFRRAVKLDPSNYTAWLGLASAAAALGWDEEAERAAARAVAVSKGAGGGGSWRAYLALGRVYLREGRHDDALRCFNRAIEASGGAPSAWNDEGETLLRMGRLEAGLRSFDEAVARASGDRERAAYMANRGGLLIEMGRPERAVGDLARAVELDPENPRAWILLGLARKRSGDATGALRDIEKGLTHHPRSEVLWNNRGNVLNALGRPAEAVKSYSVAVSITPGYEVAWHNMGAVLLRTGDTDGALDCMKKRAQLARAGKARNEARRIARAMRRPTPSQP